MAETTFLDVNIFMYAAEATRRLLTSFFATGEADDSLYTYHAVSFKAGLGFPAQAKIIVAAILLVIVILIGVVRVVIKRKLGVV